MITFLPSREVVLQLFSFEVRWYGVLYIIAFALALYLLPRLQKYRGLRLSFDDWLVIVAWSAMGVMVGGRLGYVLLYDPRYFLEHPLEIFALWRGGMASHGGFIGVGLTLWILSRYYRWDFWRILDVVVVPVALGLALGRLGNWINQELYITGVAHALAVGKDLVIAGICYAVLRISPSPFLSKERVARARREPGEVVGGRVLATFLILYSVLRFLTEYVRVQEWPLVLGLTRGQLFTIPLFFIGVLLCIWRRGKRA